MKLILISLLIRTCLTSVEWPNASSTKVLTQPIDLSLEKPLMDLKKMEVNGSDMKEVYLDWEIAIILMEV